MNGASNHWWMIVARGAASFALAVFLLLGPGYSSMPVLIVASGAYFLLDGAGSLAFVFRTRGVETATYVGRGLLGLAAGVRLLALPPAAMSHLYLVVAIWSLFTGGFEVAFGSRNRSVVERPLGFVVEGFLCIGLGLTALVFLFAGPVTLRILLAVYGLANGIAATALGNRMQHAPATGTAAAG